MLSIQRLCVYMDVQIRSERRCGYIHLNARVRIQPRIRSLSACNIKCCRTGRIFGRSQDHTMCSSARAHVASAHENTYIGIHTRCNGEATRRITCARPTLSNHKQRSSFHCCVSSILLGHFDFATRARNKHHKHNGKVQNYILYKRFSSSLISLSILLCSVRFKTKNDVFILVILECVCILCLIIFYSFSFEP